MPWVRQKGSDVPLLQREFWSFDSCGELPGNIPGNIFISLDSLW